MKYLSILSLMTAFAAFSTDASAKKDLTLTFTDGCFEQACQTALNNLENQCQINLTAKKRKLTVNTDCTEEQFQTIKDACPACTISLTKE